MTNKSTRRQTSTLAELSRTIKSEGISVRTKCYRVTSGEHERYEVLLDAAGQRAMVDVVLTSAAGFSKAVEVAAHGFAASLATQMGGDRL